MSGPASPRAILISRRLIVAVGVLSLAPWLLLAYVLQRLPAKPEPTPAPAATPANPPGANAAAAPALTLDEDLVLAKPGPWGNLVYTRILIEPPEELVVRTQSSNAPVSWFFADATPQSLDQLWRSAELPAAVVRELNDPANRVYRGNLTEIRVRQEIIWALSDSARLTIYDVLAGVPENALHAEPFRFRADAVDEWFSNSEVPPATIELVKKLLYRRGPAVLFSDLELVLARVPTLEERTRLVKTLARKSTLLVRLVVDPTSDLEALADYWGRGLRSKDVLPLLRSLRGSGRTARIDIAHLLPRFARARLYSYPSAAGGETAVEFMDCHWTVMNFFNLEPNDRFQKIEVVSEVLNRDYRPVTGKSSLGDILMFARPDGSIIHSCVYVADDIVFTKNGTSPAAPWILQNLADVLAIYPSNEPFDIQRYRLRTLP